MAQNGDKNLGVFEFARQFRVEVFADKTARAVHALPKGRKRKARAKLL